MDSTNLIFGYNSDTASYVDDANIQSRYYEGVSRNTQYKNF